MQRVAISLPSCIVLLVLAAQGAVAGGRTHALLAAAPTSTSQSRTSADQRILKAARRSHGSHASNKKPHKDKRIDKPVEARAVTRVTRRGNAQTAQKSVVREQSERDARAERLYRSSQFSAPIIPDATACKRIGAHGESIYENCPSTPSATQTAGM